MKIVTCLILLTLTGCAVVMWDGHLPAKEYQITFLSTTNEPIAGITSNCFGNEVWPSQEMAKEINSKADSSDSNGLIVLSHTGYGVGGSYKQFGSIEWGHSKSAEVTCTFSYKGKIVTSGELKNYNEPKTVLVNIEKI